MYKKLIYSAVALLGLLVISCTEPPPVVPPAPTCGTDEAQTEAPVWHDPVAAKTHVEHRHYGWGGWGPWQNGKCSGWGWCEERTVTDVPAQDGYWGGLACTAVHPACDPRGGCAGDTRWQSVKGEFSTLVNTSTGYGDEAQGADITWTAVMTCEWNYGTKICESTLPVFQAKVRATMLDGTGDKTSYVAYVNGQKFTAKTVDTALDGSKWYTVRGQYGGDPLYEGIEVITSGSKEIVLFDETGPWTLWSFTNTGKVYNFSDACSDPPDYADTKLGADGAKMLGYYPGMTDWNVAHFLVLNGISQADADKWVASKDPGGWQTLKLGEYAVLPVGFTVPA